MKKSFWIWIFCAVAVPLSALSVAAAVSFHKSKQKEKRRLAKAALKEESLQFSQKWNHLASLIVKELRQIEADRAFPAKSLFSAAAFWSEGEARLLLPLPQETKKSFERTETEGIGEENNVPANENPATGGSSGGKKASGQPKNSASKGPRDANASREATGGKPASGGPTSNKPTVSKPADRAFQNAKTGRDAADGAAADGAAADRTSADRQTSDSAATDSNALAVAKTELKRWKETAQFVFQQQNRKKKERLTFQSAGFFPSPSSFPPSSDRPVRPERVRPSLASGEPSHGEPAAGRASTGESSGFLAGKGGVSAKEHTKDRLTAVVLSSFPNEKISGKITRQSDSKDNNEETAFSESEAAPGEGFSATDSATQISHEPNRGGPNLDESAGKPETTPKDREARPTRSASSPDKPLQKTQAPEAIAGFIRASDFQKILSLLDPPVGILDGGGRGGPNLGGPNLGGPHRGGLPKVGLPRSGSKKTAAVLLATDQGRLLFHSAKENRFSARVPAPLRKALSQKKPLFASWMKRKTPRKRRQSGSPLLSKSSMQDPPDRISADRQRALALPADRTSADRSPAETQGRGAAKGKHLAYILPIKGSNLSVVSKTFLKKTPFAFFSGWGWKWAFLCATALFFILSLLALALSPLIFAYTQLKKALTQYSLKGKMPPMHSRNPYLRFYSNINSPIVSPPSPFIGTESRKSVSQQTGAGPRPVRQDGFRQTDRPATGLSEKAFRQRPETAFPAHKTRAAARRFQQTVPRQTGLPTTDSSESIAGFQKRETRGGGVSAGQPLQQIHEDSASASQEAAWAASPAPAAAGNSNPNGLQTSALETNRSASRGDSGGNLGGGFDRRPGAPQTQYMQDANKALEDQEIISMKMERLTFRTVLEKEAAKLKERYPGFSLQTELQSNISLWFFAPFMRKILCALLLNAIEAMGGKAKQIVKVTSQTEGDFFVFTVEDQGSGLTNETASKAFSLYFSTKSQLGVGLNMAETLILANDGALELLPGENGGAKALVKLPLSGFLKAQSFQMMMKQKKTKQSAGAEGAAPPTAATAAAGASQTRKQAKDRIAADRIAADRTSADRIAAARPVADRISEDGSAAARKQKPATSRTEEAGRFPSVKKRGGASPLKRSAAAGTRRGGASRRAVKAFFS